MGRPKVTSLSFLNWNTEGLQKSLASCYTVTSLSFLNWNTEGLQKSLASCYTVSTLNLLSTYDIVGICDNCLGSKSEYTDLLDKFNYYNIVNPKGKCWGRNSLGNFCVRKI